MGSLTSASADDGHEKDAMITERPAFRSRRVLAVAAAVLAGLERDETPDALGRLIERVGGLAGRRAAVAR